MSGARTQGAASSPPVYGRGRFQSSWFRPEEDGGIYEAGLRAPVMSRFMLRTAAALERPRC